MRGRSGCWKGKEWVKMTLRGSENRHESLEKPKEKDVNMRKMSKVGK